MFRQSSKWGLVLAGLLGLAGSATAQVVFEEKSKDLGGAARGTQLDYQFKFTNKYNQELHVSGLRTSCGVCSAASVTKSTLAPGESAFVNVNIFTGKYMGSRTFTVFVNFDRPSYEEQLITVTAQSRDDLMVSPSTIAMGTVKLGAEPEGHAIIDYRGSMGNWTVTGMDKQNDYLNAKVQEVSRQAGHVSYKVSVKLKPGCPAGSWHTDLWLNTNDPTSPKIRVPLTVEIQPSLTAAPQSLDLGRVVKGTPMEKRVVLRGAEPFKITKIEGLDASVEVTGQSDEAKNVQVLKVRYNAGDKPGEFTKQLKIVTNLPKDNSVEVTLKGNQSP